MLALDAYRPDQWRDFFVMVGSSSAALTGLIFVALSLNVSVVTQDDLANWISASREAVARALGSLRKRGLITTGRREITIIDLPALRDTTR